MLFSKFALPSCHDDRLLSHARGLIIRVVLLMSVMWLRRVKPKLFLAAIFLALLFASCLGPRETSFYSHFSMRELVERNKAAAGLNCEAMGGGGGGIHLWSGGVGGSRFDSQKSESFACRLNSEANFDEGRFFSGLESDTEHALREGGLQIVDHGASGPARFFLTYTQKTVQGRIEISTSRVGAQYYNVLADLHEHSN